MREYFVQFREMPASKIDGKISFNILRAGGDTRNCIVDNVRNTFGSYIGLSYSETLKAESIRAAVNAARGDMFELSSMLSFGTGVSVSEPRPYVAFTNEKDQTRHQFYQCEEISDFPYSSGTARSDSITQIIRRFGELESSEQGRSVRDRLGSSLQILRRAQGIDDDPFTQFILLWAALEVLNDPLVRELGLDDPERCPSCGRSKDSINVRGFRAYAERFSEDKRDDFEACYSIRNEILHRTKDFVGARNRAQARTPFLMGFYYSIANYLLNIPSDSIPEKFTPRIACYFEHFIEFELSESGPIVTEGLPDLPHLEREPVGDDLVRSGETTEILHRSKFTRVNFPANITAFSVDSKVRFLGIRVRNVGTV